MPFPILFPVLVVLSALYAGIIHLRNRLYDWGMLSSVAVSARVVSLGNLTVGGTGKTPLVLKAAKEAMQRGYRPAVLARGYKGHTFGGETRNDEGLLLAADIPELPLYQQPRRVDAAKQAIQEKGADFLLMDDGYQHRRLARDVDVLLVDASCPFGFDRVLPAGLLREPLSGFRRAHAIVLTRCDQVHTDLLAAIEARLDRLAPGVPRYRSMHRPSCVRDLARTDIQSPQILEGREVYLFSGIANPRAFAQTLLSLGAKIKGQRIFPDHHWYGPGDWETIGREAAAANAEMILTTAKDGAKLACQGMGDGVFVLDVEFSFLASEEAFWDRLFNAEKS